MSKFFVSLLASLLLCANAHAAGLLPFKMGNMYCYAGWSGDTDIAAHAILSNWAPTRQPVLDEGDARFALNPGAHAIDVEIQHFVRNPGWNIRFTDLAFYRAHRDEALECMRQISPTATREHSFAKFRASKVNLQAIR